MDFLAVAEGDGGAVRAVQPQLGFGVDGRRAVRDHADTLAGPPPATRAAEGGPELQLGGVAAEVHTRQPAMRVVVGYPVGVVLAPPQQAKPLGQRPAYQARDRPPDDAAQGVMHFPGEDSPQRDAGTQRRYGILLDRPEPLPVAADPPVQAFSHRRDQCRKPVLQRLRTVEGHRGRLWKQPGRGRGRTHPDELGWRVAKQGVQAGDGVLSGAAIRSCGGQRVAEPLGSEIDYQLPELDC